MDSAFRDRMQNRVDRFQSLGRMPKSLLTVPAIVVGFLYCLAGDMANVRREWPNCNFAKADAVITTHKAVHNGFNTFDHYVEYKYKAGDREITNTLQIPSHQEEAFEIGEITVEAAVGKKMPVFYSTESPEIHDLYYDPGESFWSSAMRLAYVGLFLATCVLIAVLVVVLYRPKKTDRYYLPAKIELPADIE
jgi:hypothetical protein